MNLALVVLAAGMSSRYGGGLKQTDAVGPCGEALVDYAAYDAIRAGFTRIVFVVRPEIEADFGDRIARLPEHVRGSCVYQALDQTPPGFAVPPTRRKPWGTGHAVLAAASAVTTPFAVVNADDFYGASAFRATAAHLRAHQAATPPRFALVGYRLSDTLSPHGGVSRAVCAVGPDGFVQSVTEVLGIERRGARIAGRSSEGREVALKDDDLVSMNCWGFTPAVFDLLEAEFAAFLRAHGQEPGAEFLVSTAVNDLVASGKVRLAALQAADTWCGVTSRQDREAVRARIGELVARRVYPAPLFG